MAKIKTSVLKNSIKWHNWLGWAGGLSLLMFAISGMMHPVMSWTGPKAVSFFPPQTKIKSEQAVVIPDILQSNFIDNAIMVKIVPSEIGAVLQVTEQNDSPRRYFDLSTGDELQEFDKKQAIWLAKYYSGLKNSEIKSIKFQTEFDSSYPWVNRLLPVYKVTFDSEDNLTIFIYTEINALAGITNDYKTFIQSFFRVIHTWNWLENFEYARVFLMMLLLLSLFGLAVTGTAMVFLMKNRKMEKKRKIHRIISYGIWIPLLFFSASGIYHLLQYSFGEKHRGLQLGEPINVDVDKFGKNASWLKSYSNITLNGLSLVEGSDNNLLYRLSIPKGKPGQKVERAKRFDGVLIEKPALYFDVKSGNEVDISDKDMAIYYAGKHLDSDNSKITNTQIVTRFGPHYDFRNKRLPVWRIDYDTDLGDKLFIDPATGMMVDRLVDYERYESYSFSFLHKWSFITPFIGRKWRDILIVIILSFAVLATILGYIMLLKPKAKKRK